MKIALGQLNPTVGAFKRNAEKILQFVQRAKKQKADLIVFPELSLVGYPPMDLLDKDHFVEDNLRYLNQLAKEITGISALIGFIDRNPAAQGNAYFNAAAMISNGKIISKHYKSLLPSYDVFDETRHFEPAPQLKDIRVHQTTFAVSICEDIWNDKDFWKRRRYPIDPLPALLQSPKSGLLNISASPYALGKQKMRIAMLQAIAKKYKTPIVYVNQVGGNDQLIFDGASLALNKEGGIIAQCHDFREDLIVVDLAEELGPQHAVSQSGIEAVYRALVLGIEDYVSKCGFKKALVGLSGGVDSAVTIVLAVAALGKNNVTGVMMPSRYSTLSSLKDAKDIVKTLGIPSKTISIEPMFECFLKNLKPVFKDKIGDITEQNLQARIRGNLLMALSNQTNALVLSTGNKSEMATGYSTLYGDMSGGLAVLSDIPKTMVYELARYINRKKSIIPKNTIIKPPSAELKPNQTDQDTLPPYEQLDKMIAAYVEEHKSIAQITQMGFPRNRVEDMVTRIDQNEYKRRQAPTGLRVTHKAFGLGRRLPIAQQYREFNES